MRFLALLVILSFSYVFGAPGQRIIGGSPARAGQFPFSAAVRKHTANGNYFCGGALISNEWILTSGGCVFEAVQFTIQLGSNKLNADDSSRVTVSTSTFVLHPDYKVDTFENDVGLIQLHIAIEFNDYIKSIYLPTSDLPSSITVTAIGWGQIDDESSDLTEELQYTQLSPIPIEECRLVYADQITDNMVCVSGNFNEGTCHGDIGGPLVEHLSSMYSWVVGVASFLSGNGCESSDPSGFTRVFPYKNWISNVTIQQ